MPETKARKSLELQQLEQAGLSKPVLRISYAVAIIAFLIGIGAVVFHTLEGWNWLDSIYFAVETVTTVGYGDFVPKHELTRLFLIFYMLAGVATVLFALTNVARYYLEKRENEFEHYIIQLRSAGQHARRHLSKVPRPPTAKKHV
jgi:voltage-gated potassium channel Kch